jgi:hypothetical protein
MIAPIKLTEAQREALTEIEIHGCLRGQRVQLSMRLIARGLTRYDAEHGCDRLTELGRASLQVYNPADLSVARELVLVPSPKPKNKRVIYAADPSCDYFTPAALRVVVNDVLGGVPGFDPATSSANPMQAGAFYTKEINALVTRWPSDARTIFCNPPYGRKIRAWIKLLSAAAERGATVLALTPCRPGSIWYIQATRAAQLVCELKGRVTYELPSGAPAPAGARWASCFLYWGPDRQRVARKLRDVGEVRLCRRLAGSEVAQRDVIADPRQLRLVKP